MQICKKCQVSSAESANFCSSCGEKLTARASAVKAHAPKVLDKYLKAQESIEGSRRLVTVVFADINGFTALCERLDPEAVREMVNQYFNRLGQVVFEFEGYIDKFMGDCIMALFGAPIAHENDPELAIRCAIKMIEELKKINIETGHDLSMSIGINSGMVIAGGVGTDMKLDFTVMGDAVNLAQRLGAAAGKDQIYVGQQVIRTCDKIFEYEALPPLTLKGKESPVEACSVLGFKKRQLAGRSDGLTKLVGRKEEIEIIQKTLDALSATSSLLFISGDAGMGKSRLKFEMRRVAQTKKINWFEAKGSEFQQESPYVSLIALLHPVFTAQVIDKLPLDSTSKYFLRELLQVNHSKEGERDLNPNQRKHAIFVSVKKALSLIAKTSPTILFLDDLQWADALSVELLAYLMDDLPKKNLLISGSFRPEFSHSWQNKKYFNQMILKSLSSEDSMQFVKDYLSIEKLPTPLKNWISENSEGNPLYIQEMVKSLIDSGQITRQGEHWNIHENLEAKELSFSLQGLVAARIDRLHLADKVVLQYASVIGRQFSDLLLARVSGAGEQLYDSLQFLRKKELIFEVSSKDQKTEYVFNHVLTQKVAYDSILQKKRKEFHMRVGTEIETLSNAGAIGGIGENLSELIRHFIEGGNSEKAVYYLQKQAQKSADEFNNRIAVKNYLSALDLLANNPASNNKAVEISLELIEIYILVGDLVKAESMLRSIFEQGKNLNDFNLMAKTSRRLGDIERLRGNKEQASYHLNFALGCAQKAQNKEVELKIYKSLGSAMRLENNLEAALDYLKKGLDGARQYARPELISEFLNDIGAVLIGLSDLDTAEKVLGESKNLSGAQAHKSTALSATINLGVIQFMRNNIDGAVTRFREASQNARAMGDLANAMTCEHNIGIAALQLEKFQEAEISFEQSLGLALDMGNHLERINNQIFAGYVKISLGKEDEGLKLLLEGISEAGSRNYGVIYCEGKLLHSRYLNSKGNLAAAQLEITEAAKKAQEIKNRLVLEKCKLEMNKISAKGRA